MLLEEAVPMYHVSGTPCKLLEEDVTTYHISGMSCKLLDEDVTTYQERLASYLKKILKCIRNDLQVTFRRCYNVGSGVGRFVPDPVPYPFQIQNTHGYRLCPS